MKYDVITVGGATEDIAFYTDEGQLINNSDDILRQQLIAFEYGAKINIDKNFFGFGGGAANTAVCLSKLGLKSACCAMVGDDNRGQKIMTNLKSHNVDVSLMKKNKQDDSGLSFVLICQNNERIIFSNRGANSKLSILPADLKKISQAKWVYICSLSGAWHKVIAPIFSLKNIKIAWNPGHFQLKNGYQAIGKYLKKTEMLILNKDEAIELVLSNPEYDKNDNKFLNNPFNLLKILKSWGPTIVVITNGKEGAVAFDGEKFYTQHAFPSKKVMDKTGVGDAFGSTLVAGLEIYRGNLKKSLELAARNSASVVAKQGAQHGLIKMRKK